MKKFWLVLLMMVLCVGCTKVSTKSGRSYDFTVVPGKDVPAELVTQIEKHKVNPFSLSMTDQGYLYIAVGYGEQETGGYSIRVEYLKERGEDLAIGTSLVGSKEGQVVKGKKSYPYIVVKTEEIDKNVVYE